MTDRGFQRANDESRERLARLVETLTPTQLAVDLGEGWTVASALAHMGFCDRWQAERLTEMLAGRWSAQDESVIAAEHVANEALHPYWAGVDAEDVPALALEAATRLDALIAAAPNAIVDALDGTPSAYLLHRHRHRGDHLDHIERSITAVAESVDRSFVERNAESRRRLAALVERLRLTPADLALSAGDGAWTVGQILGHLTFWDRFVAARWRAALAGGPGRQPTLLPHDLADLLNDGLPPTWAAFASGAGEAAVAETMAGAEEVDRIIAGLPVEAPIGAILRERPALLDRSIHRLEHMENAEKALAMPRGISSVDNAHRDSPHTLPVPVRMPYHSQGHHSPVVTGDSS